MFKSTSIPEKNLTNPDSRPNTIKGLESKEPWLYLQGIERYLLKVTGLYASMGSLTVAISN